MANLLTLEEWASRTYETPPSLSSLRCWAREGGLTLRRNLAGKYKRQRNTATKQALPGESYYHRCAGRQSEVTALNKKYTVKLADAKAENDALQRKLDNGGRGSSKASLQCQPQPKQPTPPAWGMMPASNSLQLQGETFSVSGPESSATKQP